MLKKLIRNNFFYALIIFLLVVVQLVFSYLYKNASVSLLEITRDKNFYFLENQKLKSKIAEFSSLSKVEEKALKMGFIYE